jgi:hypothetical protein
MEKSRYRFSGSGSGVVSGDLDGIFPYDARMHLNVPSITVTESGIPMSKHFLP